MKLLITSIALFIILLSCSISYKPYVTKYNLNSPSGRPDYNNPDFWAAHPWKEDPADSIPEGIADRKRDSLVDVFFVHPTTYTNRKLGSNADINSAELAARTDYTTLLYQASVFNQHSRLFSPRYRQAHISEFFKDNAEKNPAFDTAYADIKNAFEAYLSMYHNGRPLIIAAHSQGSVMALRLLKEYVDGKPLQKQLVAAYIIGWPVPENLFQHINVCSMPEQTNCFCSWRTYKEGFTSRYVKREKFRALVTNPLSWSTDTTYIPKDQNKGSVLRDLDIVPQTTGARIHGNVLWVDKPVFKGSIFLVNPNYHIGDINLFYVNLRENIERRILAFTGKQSVDPLH